MNFDDGEDMVFNDEEDEIDAEADEVDKDFLKEISKPTAAKKPSQKDVKKAAAASV